MIVGTVTDDGTPVIELEIASQKWIAIVDTGFNSFLELPNSLWSAVNPTFLFESLFFLAAGAIRG